MSAGARKRAVVIMKDSLITTAGIVGVVTVEIFLITTMRIIRPCLRSSIAPCQRHITRTVTQEWTHPKK